MQRCGAKAQAAAPKCDDWPAAAEAGSPVRPLLGAWSEFGDLLPSARTAGIGALELRRRRAEAEDGIARPAFRAQDAGLLADGLHYEVRIAECNALATRTDEPHDFCNAWVWLRHPLLKRSMNARQAADIRVAGPKQRTRGQCALTHFDEAGAIVWLTGPALLRHWDAHDWSALFVREQAAWGSRIAITVIGHALLEHAWRGSALPVAKALAVQVPPQALARQRIRPGAIVARWPRAEAAVAAAIADARVLADPQELRPLPLAGIPGWHAGGTTEAFVREAPCFRPLRAGRRYPQPLGFDP